MKVIQREVTVTDHPVVACSLDGPALSGRQRELRLGVLSQASSVERLSNGYRWRFDAAPELLARLGPVLDAERRCCRFLRMSIDAEPDLGAVVLEITGPEGTTDFLDDWVGGP
jgi:hypothetical protein